MCGTVHMFNSLYSLLRAILPEVLNELFACIILSLRQILMELDIWHFCYVSIAMCKLLLCSND